MAYVENDSTFTLKKKAVLISVTFFEINKAGFAPRVTIGPDNAGELLPVSQTFAGSSQPLLVVAKANFALSGPLNDQPAIVQFNDLNVPIDENAAIFCLNGSGNCALVFRNS